jgi:ABC-type transport system involved in Fe-S cluster assembly fused permease/ATPase subunit
MRVLLETMLFSIGPAMIDVLGAAIYLSAKEAWMATIVLVSVVCYVPVTIIITEQRGKLRRNLNVLDNRKSAKVWISTCSPVLTHTLLGKRIGSGSLPPRYLVGRV